MKYLFYLLLMMLSLKGAAQPQQDQLTASNTRKKSKENIATPIVQYNLYLFNPEKPTDVQQKGLEHFLFNDITGREIIHDAMVGKNSPVYFVISDPSMLHGNTQPFVKFMIADQVLSGYLNSARVPKLIDSLLTKNHQPSILNDDKKHTTIILLNEEMLRKGLQQKEGARKNSSIHLDILKPQIYLIKVNKNALRGGPRFRR